VAVQGFVAARANICVAAVSPAQAATTLMSDMVVVYEQFANTDDMNN